MLYYGFYNSNNMDRVYNAEDFGRFLDGVITDGILPTYGSQFAVSWNNGMNVTVGTGKAWIAHTYTILDSPLVLPIEPSDGAYPRLDQVVLEVNQDTRVNSIYIAKGKPASDYVGNRLIVNGTYTIYRYVLATVLVPAGATALSSSAITNLVGVNNQTPSGPPYSRNAISDTTIKAINSDLLALSSSTDSRLDVLENKTVLKAADGATFTSGFVNYNGSFTMNVSGRSWTMGGVVNVSTAPSVSMSVGIALINFTGTIASLLAGQSGNASGSFCNNTGVSSGIVAVSPTALTLSYRTSNPPTGYFSYFASGTLMN